MRKSGENPGLAFLQQKGLENGMNLVYMETVRNNCGQSWEGRELGGLREWKDRRMPDLVELQDQEQEFGFYSGSGRGL